MTPGDEQRMVREAKRIMQAERLFRRSMHFSAAAAVLGGGAGFLIVRHGAMPGALWLIVASFVMHVAAHRLVKRGRAML